MRWQQWRLFIVMQVAEQAVLLRSNFQVASTAVGNHDGKFVVKCVWVNGDQICYVDHWFRSVLYIDLLVMATCKRERFCV